MIGALLGLLPARFCRSGIPPRRLKGFCGAWAVQPEAAPEPKEIPMTKTAKKRTAARSTTPSTSRPRPGKAGQKGNRIAAVQSGTKQSAAIEMLRSPGGATIAALTKSTGWQSHSVRGFLAGVVRKRLRLDLESGLVEGIRVYRIPAEQGARPASDGRKS